MKKTLILAIILLTGVKTFAQFPEATISNGLVEARLYLPDANEGFYRAARFDWSGIVTSVKYEDHTYFGQWYKTHNPKTNDAIQGPVEAFDPIGYDTAKPGETFLKIGVGMVKKINDGPYRFSAPYEIVNGGKWTIRKKKDRVEFTQELNDASGYAYTYKKTVRLTKGKPELVLEHTLKNKGTKDLVTNAMNHNFIIIDSQPTGPEMSVQLSWAANNEPAQKDLISFENKQLTYLQELKEKQYTMEYPTGFSTEKVEDYDFKIENRKTGAGVRITADKPMSKFMYWSIPTVLSPEPFIQVNALPGKESKWNIKYEFYSKGSTK